MSGEPKLDKNDLVILRGFFEADEHEFDYGKNAYIKELPIMNRIEEVDPSASFIIKSISVRPSAGDGGKEVGTVTVHASMTIKGSTRESTGMAVILKSEEKKETKWENGKKVDTGNVYTVEANQAEKSATTDALKRCARLFGIGRYMLDFGNDVKDTASLQRWLDRRYWTSNEVSIQFVKQTLAELLTHFSAEEIKIVREAVDPVMKSYPTAQAYIDALKNRLQKAG